MNVEIITIGDEILIGQIIDTNSAWMANELTKSGFEITEMSSIGDNSEAIIKCIDLAFKRADVLLLTGGVGPTNDDVTKHTLCQYFHTALVFNDEVLQNIEQIFSTRNFQLNPLTRNQAYVPANSIVIQNKVGTAPILWFEKDGKVLVSMPGVPYEMKSAMINDIIPRLQEKFQAKKYLRQSFLVSGITESALAIQLTTFENELPNGFSLAYLPSFGMIRLRLSARGDDKLAEIEHQSRKLKRALGDLLVDESEKPLGFVLGKKLKKLKLTLSTAESCTGGYIAHLISVIPGASAYYKGSIVSYDNSIKENLLGVDKDTIKSHGAVSKEVVEEMALRVSEQLKTDCSIAVSGIMGPTGGTAKKPIGTVWVCTKYGSEMISRKYNVGNSRDENIFRTANMAMLQLLKMLK